MFKQIYCDNNYPNFPWHRPRVFLVLTVLILLIPLSSTALLAGDFGAEIGYNMWLSDPGDYSREIYPEVGDSFAVTAVVKNTSSAEGPYGGAATFDIHVKVTRPDGTIADDHVFDQIGFSLDQEMTFQRGAVTPITANQEGMWRIDWEVWNPYYYGENQDPDSAEKWEHAIHECGIYKTPSGEILSSSPTDFTGYTTRTVSVNVNNTGLDDENLIVEWSDKPSDWSISPQIKSLFVGYNTTTSFTFQVTSPGYDSSGTIEWELYYDDDPDFLLDTYNQSVTKTVPEAISQPDTPTFSLGPNRAGDIVTFFAGGSVSNKGNTIEYRFNWGDGSGWSDWSNGTDTHIWNQFGTYYVYAQARSATNPSIVSTNSDTVPIPIVDSQPVGGTPQDFNRPDLIDPNSHLEVFNGSRFQDVDPETGLFIYDGIDVGRTGQMSFDFTKPTLVLIHGWRRDNIGTNLSGDEYLRDSDLPDWVEWSCVNDQGALQNLGHRSQLSSSSSGAKDLNIAAWNWAQNSSTKNFNKVPDESVAGESVALSDVLLKIFNGNSQKPLHLIGHSLGAGVSVHVTSNINKKNQDILIDQITMFDAPEYDPWDILSDFDPLMLDEDIKLLVNNGVWIDNYKSCFGKNYQDIFNVDFEADSYSMEGSNHSFPYDWYFPGIGSLDGTLEINDGEVSKDVGAAWSQVLNTLDIDSDINDMRDLLVNGPDPDYPMKGRTYVIDPDDLHDDPYSLVTQDSYDHSVDYSYKNEWNFSNVIPEESLWMNNGDVRFENGRAVMRTASPSFLYKEITLEPTAKKLSFVFKLNDPLASDKLSVFFEDKPLWIFDGSAFPADEQDFLNSGPIPVSRFAGQTGTLTFVYDSNSVGKEVEIARLHVEAELASEGGYKLMGLLPDIDPSWQFNTGAGGVAIGSEGYVYFIDGSNNRINKFTNDGVFVTSWGSYGSGDGQFKIPMGIAVDSAGSVYVTEYMGNRIQKFTKDGVYIFTWGRTPSKNGEFSNPRGVAVDSAGGVYVADTYNDRIQKFTSEGVFITAWGSEGSGNGQFETPMGIAVDSAGSVYVADEWNRRIQKFTSDGVFITSWGSYGSGDGQFSNPRGVAVDSAGSVYVADTYNDRIQKFTSEGVFITAWGSEGSGNGQFDNSHGVAVDSAGSVYVADEWNHRIQKFAPEGEVDINVDGIVDYYDLERLANRWLWRGNPGAIQEDLVKDGIVNFLDFAKLAESWMK